MSYIGPQGIQVNGGKGREGRGSGQGPSVNGRVTIVYVPEYVIHRNTQRVVL